MFTLVEFQLSLRSRDIFLGHTMGVKVKKFMQCRRDLVFGCLGKGESVFNDIMQVPVFQLGGDGEDMDYCRYKRNPPR